MRGRRCRFRDGGGADLSAPSRGRLGATGKPPLAGLLVVDLSRHLPGPLATRMLGDLGARVVKIEEPPGGDPVRRGLEPGDRGADALAALLLSGVESVALDLKQPPARDALLRLLAAADVVVESFRPGVLARFGLDPAELRSRFPRLVVCSLTGFGQEGPRAAHAGHDLTYQALAGGLASAPRVPAQPVADLWGASAAVNGILAALWARERGGHGAWIDAALLDAGVAANVMGWAAEARRPRAVGEPLVLSGAAPCYGVYPTRDGRHLALALIEAKFWDRFCAVASAEPLAARQWEGDPETRRAVAAVVAARTAAEWEALLAGEDLPIATVLSAGEAACEPQIVARALLQHGEDGHLRVAFVPPIDGYRAVARGAVPRVGEHTSAVLAALGVPDRPSGPSASPSPSPSPSPSDTAAAATGAPPPPGVHAD